MKKVLLHNLEAVLFNALVGFILAFALGFNLIVGAVAFNGLAVALAAIKCFYTGKPIFENGYAFAGLFKEVWLAVLMENFYPDGSWLLRSQDMTSFVENNKINLADCGVDPVVLINNTTYPIGITERTDVPLELPLDYYDTGNGVVRNATLVQLAYDKLASVIKQHRFALFTANLRKAAHAYAPNANTVNTPVLRIQAQSIIDVIIDAEAAFDNLDVPAAGRILVLTPAHKAALKKADKVLFKEVFGQNGSKNLYGFDVYSTSVGPVYDGTTFIKKVFGAVAAVGDLKASLFYSENEVMRADGEYDMFSRLKDPEARGDIVGFQKRFLAMPIRNKFIGAIIN